MKCLLFKIIMLFAGIISSVSVFGQPTLVASGNSSYVGLEKNLLFNAPVRYQVIQTGIRQFSTEALFNGSFITQYQTGFDGDASNAVTIEVAGLPQIHTQRGAFVGFTTRYHGAKRFKIEGYDTYNGNIWRVLADETNNALTIYTKSVPSGAYTKLRFTFYEAPVQSGSGSGMIGLGELFFLHGEAANAYDGLMVQYSPNGSVGIGTATPNAAYKLNVNGKIRSKEVKVEVANWPDYVFGEDYKLPTLRETEQHIKEKGHLEGIPSAKEVKRANGIDLGEVNAKLLQKIEELTLHLIEMKKENEKQENKIKILERKMSRLKN